MSINFKRNQNKALKHITSYARVFGLAPNYDFKTHQVTNIKLFRCYSLFLSIFLLALTGILIYRRIPVYYGNYSNITNVLCVLDILLDLIGLITFFSTTFSVAFWNTDKWQELMSILDTLKQRCAEFEARLSDFFSKYINVFFVWGILAYWALFVCQIVFFRVYTSYYISFLIFIYMETILTNVAFIILLHVKTVYSCMNKMLIDVDVKKTSKEVVKLLEKVEWLYLSAGQVVEKFNCIFGWSILGLLSHSLIQHLDYLMVLATVPIPPQSAEEKESMALNFLYGAVINGVSLDMLTVAYAFALIKMSYSRRNVLFLKPMVKVGNVIGIIPIYDFKKHEICYRTFFKCYTVLITIILIPATIFSIYSRSQLPYYKDGSKFRVIFYLSVFQETTGLFTYILTSLAAAFWNTENWNRLVNQLVFLERKTYSDTSKIPITSLQDNALCLFVLGSIFYFLVICLNLYMTGSEFPVSLLPTLAFIYVEYVFSSILFNIIIAIGLKYKHVNEVLLKLLVEKVNVNKVLTTADTIGRLYTAINDVVVTFNRCSGGYIFFTSLHLTLQFLDCMLIFTADREIGIDFYVLNILYMMVVAYGPMMIIFTCDLTVKESRKLLDTCTKLERLLPLDSIESRQLMRLQNLIHTYCPVFTAAGFFQVDRSTLLSLLSTTTTYFIVAIQFNNSSSL